MSTSFSSQTKAAVQTQVTSSAKVNSQTSSSAQTLLSAQSISFDTSFGPLLAEISFNLKKGDRIGLIGHNGCGKSTLLKILSGDIDASSGTITTANQCLMARIEQQVPDSLAEVTLLDAVIARLPESERIDQGWQAEILLDNLGFASEQWSLKVATLSGGQHTRLLLARALILQPDLLLLDEPSNHLDLPTLLWLEDFLKNWRGSFVLVSHDRYLLDAVTNCTWILRDKTLQFIQLPCSQAKLALEEKDRADAHRHRAEQKEIDRVEKSAKRLAIWGKVYDNEDLARKAKQMEKRVNNLKEEQTQLAVASAWRLSLSGEKLDADRLLALSDCHLRPAPQAPVLFHLLALQVKSGDRIAIMGRNGCGKSSLLRYLWQGFQQPNTQTEGIVFHPRLHTGYYDQSLQQLNDEDSLSESLSHFAALTEDQRKMALIGAGFPFVRHQQKVSTLSGGERSRLLFVGLTLAKYSLLLLDEPTNHLDMEGKEELAQTLQQFSGAVMLVSHDRMLIEQSCNRFWLINQEKLEEWNTLEQVYALLSDKPASEQTLSSVIDREPAILSPLPSDEERLLARLVELETQLEAELARKAKHQKPAIQQQVRQEIALISSRLFLD